MLANWNGSINQPQIEKFELLLGRQMIKWMADDESFVMSYWCISSNDATHRCQLDDVPDNEYGYNSYYLFKIYRACELIWIKDQLKHIATVADFNQCKADVNINLNMLTDLTLKQKVVDIILN